MSDHPASLAADQLEHQCRFERSRRSGPGGQHRNKVETAVVLTHLPTGVAGQASERRSQAQNRAAARFRLRVNLALEVRTPRDGPSRLWRQRCRQGRLAINARHDDFPAMLAELLDVLGEHQWDARAAAERLQCTSTQLIKLLKLEPRALELVNRQRRERQWHEYR